MKESVELAKWAGLPLGLAADRRTLLFGKSLIVEETVKRRRGELVPVLESAPQGEELERVAYTVSRGVALEKDALLWKTAGLRYDLTVIPPGTIGREFPKTFGHIYSGEFIELYQVLYGSAYALLERWSQETVPETLLVEAGLGEIYLVPPGFGHVMINPFDTALVLANVIPRNVKQEYTPYEKHHGASYYLVASELGKDFTDILPNPNIKVLPSLTKVRPRLPAELQTLKGKPLYEIVGSTKTQPELARFFTKPELIVGLKDIQKSFRVIGS